MLKRSQEAPKKSQKAPRGPQEPSKGPPKRPPRGSQEASKGSQQALTNAHNNRQAAAHNPSGHSTRLSKGPAECAERFESGHPRSAVIRRGKGSDTFLQQTDFVSPGALRIPPGRANSRGRVGLLAPKTAPLAAQVRPSCLQDGPKTGQDGKMMAR